MRATGRTRTRFLAIASTVALLPALVVGGASGASAAHIAPQDCPKTYACWWVDINYGGDYYGSSKDQSTWPSGIANKDSSVFNHGTSGKAIFTYRYGHMIETMYCVSKGVKVSWVGSKQDKGNSHNWKASNDGCL